MMPAMLVLAVFVATAAPRVAHTYIPAVYNEYMRPLRLEHERPGYFDKKAGAVRAMRAAREAASSPARLGDAAGRSGSRLDVIAVEELLDARQRRLVTGGNLLTVHGL